MCSNNKKNVFFMSLVSAEPHCHRHLEVDSHVRICNMYMQIRLQNIGDKCRHSL